VRLEIRKAWLLINRQEETVNGSYAVEQRWIWVLRFAVLPFNVLATLGLIGLLLTRGSPDAGRFWPAAALLLTVVVSALGFFVMTRLRLPAVPVLAVFAAVALNHLWDRIRAGAGLRLVPGLVLLTLFLAASWRSPLGAARNPRWEAQLFTEAGRGLLEAEKFDRAQAAFRSATALDPTSPQAHQGEADAAARRGDVKGAIQALVRASAIAPGDAGIHTNLGILYFAAGRPDDCLRSMARAAELQPAAGTPHLYRGRVLQLRGDPGAADAFRRALERDPTLQGAYAGLVQELRKHGEEEEARRWIQTARERGVPLSGAP
jgi:Tfp pilus assembly protein PilF